MLRVQLLHRVILVSIAEAPPSRWFTPEQYPIVMEPQFLRMWTSITQVQQLAALVQVYDSALLGSLRYACAEKPDLASLSNPSGAPQSHSILQDLDLPVRARLFARHLVRGKFGPIDAEALSASLQRQTLSINQVASFSDVLAWIHGWAVVLGFI